MTEHKTEKQLRENHRALMQRSREAMREWVPQIFLEALVVLLTPEMKVVDVELCRMRIWFDGIVAAWKSRSGNGGMVSCRSDRSCSNVWWWSGGEGGYGGELHRFEGFLRFWCVIRTLGLTFLWEDEHPPIFTPFFFNEKIPPAG
jgi:hypothetical protein